MSKLSALYGHMGFVSKWPSYSDFEDIGAPYMPPQPEPTVPTSTPCTCIRLDVDRYDVTGCATCDPAMQEPFLPDAPSPTGGDSSELPPIFPEQELVEELKRLETSTRALAFETALVADAVAALLRRYTR